MAINNNSGNGSQNSPREGLTFDDVLIRPGLSDVMPSEVDVRSRITRSISLNIPIVASAMDAIITVNASQQIMVFNVAAERMFLCPAAKALGQSISQFIPNRFREAHGGHLQKAGWIAARGHRGRRV